MAFLKTGTAKFRYTASGMIFLGATLLCACSIQPQKDLVEADAKITRMGNRITYDGLITPETVERFKALLTPEVQELEITSFGGVIVAGIAFGELVHAAKLDVTVPHYCNSACAQYVFPAGRHKYVARGALLGWHGNVGATFADHLPMLQARLNAAPEVAAQAQPVLQAIRAEADQEAAFYRRLQLSGGAAAQLTRHAHANGWRMWVGPPKDGLAWEYQSASVALTKTALEQFGVTDIKQFWYPSTREELAQLLTDNPLAKLLAFPDYSVRPAFCTAFAPAPEGSLIDTCVDSFTSDIPAPTTATRN